MHKAEGLYPHKGESTGKVSGECMETVVICCLGYLVIGKLGECVMVIIFQVPGYMLALSWLVSVLSVSNRKTSVTNPMAIFQ